MPETPLGVVHYGLGWIGIAVARLVAARPGLRSVGAIDVRQELMGAGLGVLAGTVEELDAVLVTDAPSALAVPSADVVAHCTDSSLESVLPQLLECVDAGLPVVSTCEELAFPWREAPDLAARLDRAARDRGVSVLGTGVNPGFAMDYLPVVLSGASRCVDRVSVHRVQDAGRRRVSLQRKVGVGLTVDEFDRRVDGGGLGHVGLSQSAEMIAAAFGWVLTEVRETIEPIVAERPTPSGLGDIPPNHVTGVHQVVSGSVGEREVISLALDLAVGLEEPRDEIRLAGDPDIATVVPGGLHGDVATAAVIVNALPLAVEARPGLRVMTEIAPPRPRMAR
ncbi:MAG: dihydrodipicolinate reductase [Actinomycetota bacterium]